MQIGGRFVKRERKNPVVHNTSHPSWGNRPGTVYARSRRAVNRDEKASLKGGGGKARRGAAHSDSAEQRVGEKEEIKGVREPNFT